MLLACCQLAVSLTLNQTLLALTGSSGMPHSTCHDRQYGPGGNEYPYGTWPGPVFTKVQCVYTDQPQVANLHEMCLEAPDILLNPVAA